MSAQSGSQLHGCEHPKPGAFTFVRETGELVARDFKSRSNEIARPILRRT
jgi:hypothetical protein